MAKQTLELLDDAFTIHSFAPDHAIPHAIYQTEIFFIAKTREELSIVCPSHLSLNSLESEPGWAAFEVIGPLGFSLTGILSNISGVLAKAKISIFAISTFDTDYILVKQQSVNDAITHLKNNEYKIITHHAS